MNRGEHLIERRRYEKPEETPETPRPLTFMEIAHKSLLAADLSFSKSLAICSRDGRLRPLMKTLEISCHGLPWIFGTLLVIYKATDLPTEEVFLNLLLALLLDLCIVGAAKVFIKRQRPKYNKNDMFATVSIDNYSFPSGHATRSYLVTWFILKHLRLAVPLRMILVIWSHFVGLSRVMLGRHHITDVLAGFLIGYLEFLLIELVWLSQEQCFAIINLIK